MNLKLPFTLFLLLAGLSLCRGQVSLTGGTETIDFVGYTGAGLAPTPAAGQLDSDTWVIIGMSDGPTTPGGTHTAGDFARGTTVGAGVGVGGLYANTGGATPPSFWLQPGGADMTPGNIRLLVCNNTGTTLTGLDLSYDIITLNDQNGSCSIDFSYSTAGFAGPFTSIPSLNFVSVEAADGLTTVTPRSTIIGSLSIPDGTCIVLSWDIDDAFVSGTRDELGLDNIVLTPITTVIADRLGFLNGPVGAATFDTPFTIDVCAVDGGGNIDVAYATNINIAAIPLSVPFTIAPAASVAPINGCVTYTITPSNAGPLTIAASSGLLNGGSGSPYLFSRNVQSGLNVFISEYIEGTGTNKCIEIYNGSGVPIDLAAEGYFLTQFANGGTTVAAGSPIALTGTIAAGDVYVVCNPGAGPDLLPQADETTTNLFYSGNDGIALSNTLIGLLDFVGAMTGDPGANGWTGGGCGTANFTLVRKASVTTGDTDPMDAFDPSVEWDCYPSDTWAFLGNHGAPIVATTLAFYAEPPTGCLDASSFFRVEVCAQDANGFPQPDFANDITLSGSGPITVGGNETQSPVLGCATFFVRSNNPGALTLSASAAGVSTANTASLTINASCSEVTPITGVFRPCGNEAQNEYLVAQNGNATLDLANLTIGQVNHLAGPQPNYNFTWNRAGTTSGDNPDPVCNGFDNVCNRLLDVNDLGDEAILTTLVNDLNTQAGCNLFALPAAGGVGGEIPAGAYMMVFLGAGGDGTPGSEGFDGLATGGNLDFSGFCSGPVSTVYLVAGERSTGAAGFFANESSRTYRIMNGTAARELRYGTPPGGNIEAQSISADGTLFSPPVTTCTPDFLFDLSPLPVEWLSFRATPAGQQQVMLDWLTASELNNDRFVVQRSIDGLDFVELGTVKGTGTTHEISSYSFLDSRPALGINYYRLMQIDFDGAAHLSPIVEAKIVAEDAFALLEAYPNPVQDLLHIKVNAPMDGLVKMTFFSAMGQAVLHREMGVEKGLAVWETPLTNLPTGMYFYRIELNGQPISGKLFKE